jgi:hypothetical protein
MRTSETFLRNLIRETLLTEARFTPQTLLDKGMRIGVRSKRSKVQIYCIAETGAVLGYLWVNTDDSRDQVEGGQCLDAWEIDLSDVSISGMGPLLYDVAMELSGEHGLMPDREEVSADARGLWDFYRSRRGDVEVRQLDNLEDELTPGFEEDNCWQKSSMEDATSGSWSDSPLSKVYRSRGTPTIDALKTLGLIEIK